MRYPRNTRPGSAVPFFRSFVAGSGVLMNEHALPIAAVKLIQIFARPYPRLPACSR